MSLMRPNDPYESSACPRCGSRKWVLCEDCYKCGEPGCSNCMSHQSEAEADSQTGYREDRLVCWRCAEPENVEPEDPNAVRWPQDMECPF